MPKVIPPAEDLLLRRSSRRMVFEPQGRLLLFGYSEERKPSFSSTPGGALRDGEEYVTAPSPAPSAGQKAHVAGSTDRGVNE